MEFQEVLDLLQSQDANERAYAAQLLGNHVDALDDEQYDAAKQALNNALIDPNPMVLMAAMQSLGRFNRSGLPQLEATDDNETELVAMVCQVCGKPEMLADAATCEYSNCPYK